MKVRFKDNPIQSWYSERFNIHALSEIIVFNKDLGADSAFIKDFDVCLEQKKEWKDMGQAFRDKDLIIDNYNTFFFEPKTEANRIRGYAL